MRQVIVEQFPLDHPDNVLGWPVTWVAHREDPEDWEPVGHGPTPEAAERDFIDREVGFYA